MRVTCDSDVLSNFGRRSGRGAREVAEAVRAGTLSLNVICLFEVRGGMEDPTRIREFDRCFSHLPVLEFTQQAALQRKHQSLAVRDLFLAALSDAHQIKLLTADHDFVPLQRLGLDIVIVDNRSLTT